VFKKWEQPTPRVPCVLKNNETIGKAIGIPMARERPASTSVLLIIDSNDTFARRSLQSQSPVIRTCSRGRSRANILCYVCLVRGISYGTRYLTPPEYAEVSDETRVFPFTASYLRRPGYGGQDGGEKLSQFPVFTFAHSSADGFFQALVEQLMFWLLIGRIGA
jgi:hypothetical protein